VLLVSRVGFRDISFLNLPAESSEWHYLHLKIYNTFIYRNTPTTEGKNQPQLLYDAAALLGLIYNVYQNLNESIDTLRGDLTTLSDVVFCNSRSCWTIPCLASMFHVPCIITDPATVQTFKRWLIHHPRIDNQRLPNISNAENACMQVTALLRKMTDFPPTPALPDATTPTTSPAKERRKVKGRAISGELRKRDRK
jgi:hypothetical protein